MSTVLFVFVEFFRVRTGGRQFHFGSLGSYVLAEGVIRVRPACRWVH